MEWEEAEEGVKDSPVVQQKLTEHYNAIIQLKINFKMAVSLIIMWMRFGSVPRHWGLERLSSNRDD